MKGVDDMFDRFNHMGTNGSFDRFNHMRTNGFFVGIIPLIIILLIIFSLYMIWKYSRSKDKPESSRALERLNERFVNGEIDEEEYLKKKDLLNR